MINTLAVLYSEYVLTDIGSPALDRKVTLAIFEPARKPYDTAPMPLLILNDGQDSEAVRLLETLNNLSRQNLIQPPLVAAIYAGDRLQEYGIADKADYMKRGKNAASYAEFVLTELIPWLRSRFHISENPDETVIAGYSLGGLSAFDIAFHNPSVFGKAGVFSGSLWWRKRSAHSVLYRDNRDRIIHRIVRRSQIRPGMKFWFECGTRDETNDRNKNGVIDSIDDTLDLIVELVKIGYRPFHDIQYYEIKDG